MALREGVFFCFDENNGKYHSFFRTFIICHSPQKSSFAQKVYKPDRKAFAGLNLSVSADALPPPLPRGGLGIAENFSSSPEAPPLGELAGASPTERARPLPNSSDTAIGRLFAKKTAAFLQRPFR